jgi:hypothetical protein
MAPKRKRGMHEVEVKRSGGQLLSEVMPAPLEPLALKLVADVSAGPLELRVAAPGFEAAADLRVSVLQSWAFPFRLVRVAITFPAEFAELGGSDFRAATSAMIRNTRVTATLSIPAGTGSVRRVMLATVVRVDVCAIVDIQVAVPGGLTLRGGSAIDLHVSLAGAFVSVHIPATGHIHSALCKPRGKPDVKSLRVWEAARAGDMRALTTALAEGGCPDVVYAVSVWVLLGASLVVPFTRLRLLGCRCGVFAFARNLPKARSAWLKTPTVTRLCSPSCLRVQMLTLQLGCVGCR